VRRRGEDYVKHGAVQRIEVHEPGTHYCVYVQGTELYEVDAFHEDGDWCAACTCPYGDDCKHAYAALKSLREIANGKLKVSRDKAASRTTSSPSPAASSSALREAFERAKGKRASKREAAYLKQVTDLYEALRPARTDPTADWLGRLGIYSRTHTWGA